MFEPVTEDAECGTCRTALPKGAIARFVPLKIEGYITTFLCQCTGCAAVVTKLAEGGIAATARELYEAYCSDAGGLNYQGQPCPKWGDLPPAVQNHWGAVARRAGQRRTS